MAKPKRPRDINQLAKLITDIAIGEIPDTKETTNTIRARKGGLAGGAARAKSLTAKQRAEIARTAAAARWKKS